MKTAIITGSSRGIGLALARQYASHHWNLAINAAHDASALSLAREELSEQTNVISFLGDVSDEAFVTKMAGDTIDTFGHVDLLINNAGISQIGLLQNLSAKQWHTVMQTNLDSVFFASRALLPHMISRKKGYILNISSVWGEVGASCESAYSASKGAVNAFTKALAKEVAPSQISVNAISFGLIDTTMNQCFTRKERKRLEEEVPFGRFASPEEAAAFCFQITQSPPYLTGQILRFDGGWI